MAVIFRNYSKSCFTCNNIFESYILRNRSYQLGSKCTWFTSDAEKNLRRYTKVTSTSFHKIITKKFYSPLHIVSSKFHIASNNRKLSNEDDKIKLDSDKSIKVENKESSDQSNVEKISLVKKFKIMFKQYWYVLIPVHCVTSVIWAGAFFFAAKSGVDIVPLLESLGTSEKILGYMRSSDAGYYGITYAMYKLATPARYTVTLGGTSFTINYLKKRGYIENVPIREDLKIMYEDKREEIKERTDEMKEKYQEKRSELLEKYQDKTEEFREKYNEKKEELIQKYSIGKDNSEKEKR